MATLPAAPSSVIPQGCGAPPPPGLDPKKGKLMCIKVRMLDDTVGVFHLGHRAYGQALFDEVCRHLNLLESDYFGLEFYDCYGNRCWLDYQKPILRQITQSRSDARFYFAVKFYTPTPAELEEEYTRYLFALQMKRDLATANLPCNDYTAALMASYIVQAECGDFVEEDYPDHTYLSSTKFVPNQDAEFEKKVVEDHKKHVGLSPAEADMALLETARRCEMYGVKLHPAKDHEGVPINLAVVHAGINVYQGLNPINKFSWAKVRKLSFKRRRFLVKLHPESYGFYKDTVDFYFENRNECKMFWKKCIEHHGFFRCSEVPHTPRQQFEFFSKGSSFRYSGRTQKQVIEYVREHHKRREPFERPIHSSFPGGSGSGGQKRRTISFGERSFPTPILPIPTSRFNGDLVHSGDDTDVSQTALPPPTSAVSPGGSTDGEDLSRRSQGAAPPPYESNGTASPIRDPHVSFVGEGPGTPKLARKQLSHPQEPQLPTAGASAGAVSESGTTSNAKDSTGLLYSPAVPFATQEYLSHGEETLANTPTNSVVSPDRRNARLNSVASSSSGQFTVCGSTPHIFDDFTGSGAILKSHLVLSGASRTHPAQDSNGSQSERDIPNRLHSDGQFDPSVKRKHHRSTPHIRYQYMPVWNGSLYLHSTVKITSDKAYYIAKELLMGERTYGKDLEIVIKHFQSKLNSDAPNVPVNYFNALFLTMQPIYDSQQTLLAELEQRLINWEARVGVTTDEPHCVGDLILCNVHNSLKAYQAYLSHLAVYLAQIDELCRTNKEFNAFYKDFELNRVCYLPLSLLLLRPGHRLLQYQMCLHRFVAYYSAEWTKGGTDSVEQHPDLPDCRVALERISIVNHTIQDGLKTLENFVKLVELEKDFCGIDNLVQPNRIFLREGSLQRFSRKGPVQRMFFLFNDCLLYANRTAGAAQLQFRVHGQIPLRGLMLEDGDPFKLTGTLPFCFTIYGGNRSLVIAASSFAEKQLWVDDISKAVMNARELPGEVSQFASLKSCNSADDSVETARSTEPFGSSRNQIANSLDDEMGQSSPRSPSLERQFHHRSNNSSHVCWHRQTTVGMEDLIKAARNQLSGYILRKFRNSTGWQKLWVVYAQFCLFFYKSHQEDTALASLPLLGYNVGPLTEEDEITKEFVFKLHYRNHCYYFRAESEYSYNRWLESLRVVCQMQPVPPDANLLLE